MNVVFLLLKGMAVGGANVMPGVSGATLAVIFHIYDKLINSVNNLRSNMKESLKFLIPLGIGMVLGILAAGVVLDLVLERFSLQAAGFIVGLMTGSVPFIYSQCILKIDSKATNDNNVANNGTKKVPIKYFAIAVIAALAVILLTLLVQRPDSASDVGDRFVFSIGFSAHLFIGGMFAAAAMVVPGVSGAMVLMLFGLYPIALHTISLIGEYLRAPSEFGLLQEIFVVVLPLGVGIVAGVLLGAKLIAKLLEKWHSGTYFAILGLVFGTVFVVFNDPATYQSFDSITPGLVIFTVIAFACGGLLAMLLGKRKE